MFQVFDNNRPAQYPDCDVDACWNNSKFNTLIEAQKYSMKWLGYIPEEVMIWTLEPGKPWDYSGYGDIIEIREIKE